MSTLHSILFGQHTVALPQTRPADKEAPASMAPAAEQNAAANLLYTMGQMSAVSTAGQIKFTGIIDQRYSVEQRVDEPVNAHATSAILRELIVKDLVMRENNDTTSSLQLNLDVYSTQGFAQTEESALADIFSFLNRPVDVVVKSIATESGFRALQSATGLRLMQDDAGLMLGPVQGGAWGRDDDLKIEQELENEYMREREDLLLSRAGLKARIAGLSDREQAHQDLLSAKRYTPLEALHYGEKGLVDGVLVGYDRVVTRADLEKYLKSRRSLRTPQDIEKFLGNAFNIHKIPSRPLNEVGITPASSNMPGMKAASRYKPLKPAKDKKNKTKQSTQADATPKAQKSKPLKIYKENSGSFNASRVPLISRIKADHVSQGHLSLDQAKGERTLMLDDTIFFNDDFSDQTGEQLTDALLALDEKKSRQKNPSSIKLVINSPGGSTCALSDIQSTIRRLKHPVDVIVTGMAASAGGDTLTSTTGLRLGTPGARIMLHESAGGAFGNQDNFNEEADAMHTDNDKYSSYIAQATGRPFKQVEKDLTHDIWLNPLEAMFYGKKGILDGVLVDADRIITREQVNAYLVSELGSQKDVDKYVANRVKSLRKGRRDYKPGDHNERDPFDNAYRVIQHLTPKAKKLSEIDAFKASVPNPAYEFDYFILKASSDHYDD